MQIALNILGWLRHNRKPMPIEPQQERLYSVAEVAQLLGKSEQAIRNLCQRKRLTPAKQISGIWLITETAIKDFKEQPRGKHVTKS